MNLLVPLKDLPLPPRRLHLHTNKTPVRPKKKVCPYHPITYDAYQVLGLTRMEERKHSKVQKSITAEADDARRRGNAAHSGARTRRRGMARCERAQFCGYDATIACFAPNVAQEWPHTRAWE